MKPFLQRLAEEIAARFADDPGKVCVVLPNRRAGLYLKKYLAETLKKTVWSPQTYSVEDFITELSGYQIIDQAGLLFEFYGIHKEILGEKAQEFDVFADWAEVLLKDFDEIDQYLVDPGKIFNYLNAARALTVWNLDLNPLTDQEKGYIEFYNSFLTYYQYLNKKLKDKKQVYQGLAYRETAENIGTLAGSLKWKRVFIAGLNALSSAEETIISHLLAIDKAEVFWDADEYYIKDKNQEAGDFIRGHLEKWPGEAVKWLETGFRDTNKKINVYGIPGSTGQAQKAGQLIRQLKSDKSLPDKTALVLADEKLLVPVLYSLPEEIGIVNVTMGYPFRYTHLYQLVYQIFQLQENAEKFASQRKSGSKPFYVKDILKLLSHPYLLMFEPAISTGQVPFGKISEIIRNKNRVFLNATELTRYSEGAENEFKALNENLFRPWKDPADALSCTLAILELIRDKMISDHLTRSTDYDLDLEYIFHLSKTIKRCRNLMESYSFVKDIKTLHKILFQLLDQGRLPFSGEPLQGVQVMGVLETRAIDFENLVVLSVNEGILPSGRLPNSFIPFDIKQEFGLPTFRHKDAVFAYHFYRMLQRAANIHLLYDTEGDQMKGGEKSRFITQIGYELKKYNPATIFEELLLRPNPPAAGLVQDITVAKTPSIMERLAEKSRKGFSPTSLNQFIKCPLRFYYQEILGLTEADSVEETIEARTMGTVIHHVFQEVFEPFTGKFVNPDELESSLKDTERIARAAFNEHYSDGDLDHGKNHLIYKATLFLINQFVQNEIELIRESENPYSALKILSLESSLDQSVKCAQEGKEIEVRIKGKTDRIDQLENVIRIIDYKTGYVQASELKLDSWDRLIIDPKMSKAFQLLVYAWLYFKNEDNPGSMIQTGNITLRKISNGYMKVKLPEGHNIDIETINRFETALVELLELILDPKTPFSQTSDRENCQNCPFIANCTR
jgi:ATP-dependent helicase/nuclease subunit B